MRLFQEMGKVCCLERVADRDAVFEAVIELRFRDDPQLMGGQ